MNELKVFSSTEFGELGVMLIDGKEFFPATQCAKILGYVNPRDAVRRHCKTEGVVKHDGVSYTTNQHGVTTQQVMEINYINEGNLYRLIVNSKLPAAEKFEKWVFDEVLPSIRKNGGYVPSAEELIAKTATAVVGEVMKQLLPVLVAQTKAIAYGEDIIEEIIVQPKRQRRKPRSVIGVLDSELRAQVEDMLFDCRYTYSDIVDFLRKKGIKASQSSVARYYQWMCDNKEKE